MATIGNYPVLLRMVASSVSLAASAGQYIRSIMKTGQLDVIDKGGNDPQTKADRVAQQHIVGSLLKQYPSATIIGEEEQDESNVSPELISIATTEEVLKLTCPKNLLDAKEEDIVIWIDPLDGTREFTKGETHHVTVLIGVAYEGKAVAGVIHQPYYKREDTDQIGRTMYGIVGGGAYGFTYAEPPSDRQVIVTTKSRVTEEIAAAVDAMNPNQVLHYGGAGYKSILVLEGVVDAYLYPRAGTKKWDTCACEAILEAVGGKLTDVCGNAIQYHRTVSHPNNYGVLATMRNHSYYISRMPQSIKESLLSSL